MKRVPAFFKVPIHWNWSEESDSATILIDNDSIEKEFFVKLIAIVEKYDNKKLG